MITLVEALNYRCLRYAQRPLRPFHLLVGPNASGKTTFLDAVGFLSDLASDGLEAAVSKRSPDPRALLFHGEGDDLELAVEAKIPAQLRAMTAKPDLDTVRYQVKIGFNGPHEFEFKAETLLLKQAASVATRQPELFPLPPAAPATLQVGIRGQDTKTVINKVPGGNDNFYSEIYHRSGRGWKPSFRLGPRRSALRNLTADENSFPVATWFREYLTQGVQRIMLNSLEIKQPSPPAKHTGFSFDGSNIPWVAHRLRNDDPKRYSTWIAHLRTALPDLVDIETSEQPWDKYRFMVYEYQGRYKVPSWLVSDGTLRLTALTLPAFLGDAQGMYLIEEPENGIHPKAVQTVYDSLSSVYDAQVLLATHSPVLLNAADLDQVLCFAKHDDGAADIILGSEHPALRGWSQEVDLGTLLGSGVLG